MYIGSIAFEFINEEVVSLRVLRPPPLTDLFIGVVIAALRKHLTPARRWLRDALAGAKQFVVLSQQLFVDAELEELVLVPVDSDYFDLTISQDDCSKDEIRQLIFYQDENIENLNEPTSDVYDCLYSFLIGPVGPSIKEPEEDFDHDGSHEPKVDQ